MKDCVLGLNEVSFVTKTTIHRVVSVAEHFQSCSKVAQK